MGERFNRTARSNTAMSVLPPLLASVAIAVFGTVYPAWMPEAITTAAVGAVVALLGALVVRYVKQGKP